MLPAAVWWHRKLEQAQNQTIQALQQQLAKAQDAPNELANYLMADRAHAAHQAAAQDGRRHEERMLQITTQAGSGAPQQAPSWHAQHHHPYQPPYHPYQPPVHPQLTHHSHHNRPSSGQLVPLLPAVPRPQPAQHSYPGYQPSQPPQHSYPGYQVPAAAAPAGYPPAGYCPVWPPAGYRPGEYPPGYISARASPSGASHPPSPFGGPTDDT